MKTMLRVNLFGEVFRASPAIDNAVGQHVGEQGADNLKSFEKNDCYTMEILFRHIAPTSTPTKISENILKVVQLSAI